MAELISGYVYVTQALDHPNHIKVGWSKCPVKRVKQGVGAWTLPQALILYFPGTQQDERALHKQLCNFGAGKKELFSKESIPALETVLDSKPELLRHTPWISKPSEGPVQEIKTPELWIPNAIKKGSKSEQQSVSSDQPQLFIPNREIPKTQLK
ncbi:MAG TPA: hypothetical protein VGL56_12875 [Fimbriimonadaceae bacterium]|jgi:hypothetical protein